MPYATVAQLARRVKKTCLWQVFSQSGQDLCVLAEVQLIRIKIKIGVHTPYYATVAQLVEQLIRNQQVAGSSPASSSNEVHVVQCVLLKKSLATGLERARPKNLIIQYFIKGYSMENLSKRITLTDAEKAIHKERIAFIIIDNKIKFNKNTELSHYLWAKQLKIPEEDFPNLVRGFYKNGKASFYKGNFDYDDDCINCAKTFANIIKKFCGVDSLECWCGHKVGKVGEEWESIYFVGKF